MANTEIEQLSIDTIRTLSMDMVQQANAGHPGTAMALAPRRVPPLHRGDGPQPGEPALGRPRPVRAQRRPRVRPPVLGAASLRLQPLARGAEALPAVAVGDAGPSRVPAHRRHRGDDRPARPGLRERRRHGLRRALPRRDVQPPAARDRRPPHLRHLLRRRPDGRPLVRGGLDRRHERSRQARLLLRRQPHLDRRHDVDLVHRGSRRALRGARLARAARRRRQRPRLAARGDRERAGGDRAGRR